jgi:hypothetical protein
MLLLHTTSERRATRRRRSIATGLEHAVTRAGESRLPSGPEVPVDRVAVTECADRLLALASVLRADRELPEEGVAAARDLLTDGAGPLYLGRPGGLAHALTRIEIRLGLR